MVGDEGYRPHAKPQLPRSGLEARRWATQQRMRRLAATWTDAERVEVGRIQLLYWLYTHQQERPDTVSLSELLLEPPTEMTPITNFLDIADASQLLHRIVSSSSDDGLIKVTEASNLADAAAVITDQGRIEVERRWRRWADLHERSAAARDAFVKWLYGKSYYSHVSKVHRDITMTPAGYYEGRQFTEDDLDNAYAYLVEAGLVTDRSQARTLAQEPRLTEAGIDCVEHYEGSVNQYRTSAEDGKTEVHFRDKVSGTVAWSGETITQTTVTTAATPARELTALVRAIAEALPVLGLSTDEASRLGRDIQVIQGKLVNEQPDNIIVRTVMHRVLATLGRTADSSLALILGAHARELMRRIEYPSRLSPG
jgi:hypothetical protein